MSFDASKPPYTSAFVKKTGVFIAMVETKKKKEKSRLRYITSTEIGPEHRVRTRQREYAHTSARNGPRFALIALQRSQVRVAGKPELALAQSDSYAITKQNHMAK